MIRHPSRPLEAHRNSALANLSTIFYTLQSRLPGKVAFDSTWSSLGLVLPSATFPQEVIDIARYLLDSPSKGAIGSTLPGREI
ncbi:MAG: hypothetical protein ACP5OP_01820 [Leptospirillia bacterium]